MPEHGGGGESSLWSFERKLLYMSKFCVFLIPLNHHFLLSCLLMRNYLCFALETLQWGPPHWVSNLTWSLKNFFCFSYATVLSECVLLTSKCRLYWGGFLAVCPVQISTVGPSSLGFVLLTSNAIDTGGFPHSMSFSNLYSWHLMPLSETGVQAICLSQQSDPLNSLPHLVFWLPCTIYAGVLSCIMSLSMKDSFWSSTMSNNLPQSAAWLFPNSPSQLIIQLFCPLSTVGLSSLGFLSMKDSFWSFYHIIVNTSVGSFLTRVYSKDLRFVLHVCPYPLSPLIGQDIVSTRNAIYSNMPKHSKGFLPTDFHWYS